MEDSMVRRQHGAGLADRLLKIGQDCAAHLKEPARSAAHGDLLYDERGLPGSEPVLFKDDASALAQTDETDERLP
jgi:hypothetical protein